MQPHLLLLLLLWIDPNKIGKVNKAKSEAKEAFQRGEFKNAIAQYKTLVDSLGVKEDEVGQARRVKITQILALSALSLH